MKKCDCLPAIKNAFCTDLYCGDNRILIPIDLTNGKVVEGFIGEEYKDQGNKREIKGVWKVKVNDFKIS